MGLEGNIAARLLAIGEDEGSNGAHLHSNSVTRTTLYIRRQNLCETYVSNVMVDQDNYVTPVCIKIRFPSLRPAFPKLKSY